MGLWLPGVFSAVGCAWFNHDQAACRAHPACFFDWNRSACVSPPDLCEERADPELCTRSSTCVYNVTGHTCQTLRNLHSWYAACRIRQPLAHAPFRDAVARCLDPDHRSRIPCQWDSTRHLCVPEFRVMCPLLHLAYNCTSQPGCYWEKGKCVGLAGDNSDCSMWAQDATGCEAQSGCEWSPTDGCQPHPGGRTLSWRMACNTDFTYGYGMPCAPFDHNCQDTCTWQEGCLLQSVDSEGLFYCDASPSHGGCSATDNATLCGRIHDGGCVWSGLECVPASDWVRVATAGRLPRGDGSVISWATWVMIGVAYMALALVLNACLPFPHGNAFKRS